MKNYIIVSDGACDLGLEVCNENQIYLAPFYVSLNGKDYFKEIFELSNDLFYNELINNKDIIPKTTTPSVEDYLSVFGKGKELNTDILCICATDTLTGSIKAAQAAKSIFDEKHPDCRVEIINSKVITVAQGIFVLEAVKLRDKGMSLDETINELERIKPLSRIMFFTGGVRYLKVGGRIGRVAAIASDALNIKPIIDYQLGEIYPKGIVRSKLKGMSKIVKMTKDCIDKMSLPYDDFVYCLGTTSDMNEEQEQVAEIFYDEFGFMPDFPKMAIGSTVGSHTGPGTVGIGIIRKII